MILKNGQICSFPKIAIFLFFNFLFLINCNCVNENGQENGTKYLKYYLKSIYISDTTFKFDYDEFNYSVEVSECVKNINIFFDIPDWRNGKVTSSPVAKKPSFFQSIFKPETNLNTENENIAIKLNTEYLSSSTQGIISYPLNCGTKNVLQISVVLKSKFQKFSFQYKVNLIVSSNKVNYLKSLKLTSNGKIIPYEPILSKGYRNYKFYIYKSIIEPIKLRARCDYDTPTINSESSNQYNFQMMDTNKTIRITCPSGTIKESDSLYILEFIHSLKTVVPAPKLVMPLLTQFPCQIEDSFKTKIRIVCDHTTPNNTPFLIQTDSRYKYVISKYVKGIEQHEEISNNTITSNLGFENDLKIIGMAGKATTIYTLSKTKKYKYMGSVYRKLIYSIVTIPKWIIVFTNLFQIFIEYKLKVIFHSTPIIGYFLLMLSETICSVSATDDADIINVCNSMSPLKIFKKNINFQTDVSFLQNVLIVFIIYLMNKKPEARIVHSIKNYLPVSTIVNLFAFKFTVYFVSIIDVSLNPNKHFQINSFGKHPNHFNISINHEPYFHKNLGFMGLLSSLSFIVLLSLIFIIGFEFTISDSLKIYKKILTKELIWIWDEINSSKIAEIDESKLLFPKQLEGHFRGYWSESICDLLCTPFVPTYLSKRTFFFNNKKAYICGKIKSINLRSELDNDHELLQVILPDVLVIDTKDLSDNRFGPLNVSRAFVDDGDFDFTVLDRAYEINSNQKTYAQLETLRGFKPKLLSTVLGTIDTKDLIYYVDLNLLNKMKQGTFYRFLPVKIQINQLMKMTNNSDKSIRRNVRILLIGKIILFFKFINALLHLFGSKTSNSLVNWLQILLHTALSIYLICCKPYSDGIDNIFGFICLLVGSLFIFKFSIYERKYKPNKLNILDYLIIISLTLIVAYSIIVSILFTLDLILSLKYEGNDEYESNVQVALYAKDLKIHQRIRGYCRPRVKMATMYLDRERIVFKENMERHFIPTLAVDCNLINTGYLPFLSLFNNENTYYSFSTMDFSFNNLNYYLETIYNKQSSLMIAR